MTEEYIKTNINVSSWEKHKLVFETILDFIHNSMVAFYINPDSILPETKKKVSQIKLKLWLYNQYIGTIFKKYYAVQYITPVPPREREYTYTQAMT